MEVYGPKPLEHPTGPGLKRWARGQLEIAEQIVDNPGGGLLFATQTMGQVRAALQEEDPELWEGLVGLLERAEGEAVRREFESCRRLLGEAGRQLG